MVQKDLTKAIFSTSKFRPHRSKLLENALSLWKLGYNNKISKKVQLQAKCINTFKTYLLIQEEYILCFNCIVKQAITNRMFTAMIQSHSRIQSNQKLITSN
jgi:hypothetical protein